MGIIILTVSFILLFILVAILSRRVTDYPNNKKIMGIAFIVLVIEFFVLSSFSLPNAKMTYKIPDNIASLIPSLSIKISSFVYLTGGIAFVSGILSLLKEMTFMNHATETIGTIVGRKTIDRPSNKVGAYHPSNNIYYIIVTFQDGEKEARAKCRVREFLSTEHSNGMKIEIAYTKSLILRRYNVKGLDSNHRPYSRIKPKIIGCVSAVIFVIVGNLLFHS